MYRLVSLQLQGGPLDRWCQQHAHVAFVMFVLTQAVGLCCVWFICLVLCCFWCPMIGTNSIDWAHPSRPVPENGDRVHSLKHCFLIKKRTMDNIKKVNNCMLICVDPLQFHSQWDRLPLLPKDMLIRTTKCLRVRWVVWIYSFPGNPVMQNEVKCALNTARV
jgi:hypothetical protein